LYLVLDWYYTAVVDCCWGHVAISTGYKQIVTGCASQWKQSSCNSTKTNVNSMILILKFNLTSLRKIYCNIKSGLRWAPHTFLCICFSTKSTLIWGWGSRYLYEFSLSNNYRSSFRITSCDALFVLSDIVAIQSPFKIRIFPLPYVWYIYSLKYVTQITVVVVTLSLNCLQSHKILNEQIHTSKSHQITPNFPYLNIYQNNCFTTSTSVACGLRIMFHDVGDRL